MEAHDEELIHTLVPANDQLRHAWEEHSRLDAMVDQLGAKALLSPEEELQKQQLKKRKLAEKDKIMRILADHRRGDSTQPAT